MASFNKVFLLANCTRDPEAKHTPKGTAVTELGLAVNRAWNDDSGQKQEETTFIDCTLFGRVAEIAAQYLKKGKPVFIEGRLKMDVWDDKETGKKRSKLKVLGENIQLLGSKENGGRNEYDQRPPTVRAQTPRRDTPPPVRQPSGDPDLDSEPSDIPF